MVWFEVFIPAKDAGLPNITLTVEAPNWIGALRTGLSNLGEGHEAIANVMCDIKEDNSIHVTDVQTRRVFRLREVPAPSAKPAAAPASSLPPEMTKPMPPAPRPSGSDAPKTSPGQPRPVSMPEIPRDALDEPLPDDATIPNPIAVKDLDSSIPWTKMAGPQDVASPPTIELKASMPPPAPARAPAQTQQMFRAQVVPPAPTPQPPPAPPAPTPAAEAKTVPSQPLPQPPKPAEPPKPAPSVSAPETRPVQQPDFANAPATAQETPKKKQKAAAEIEPTERLPRAPGPSASTSQELKKPGPVAAPTPRGTPAPPPKRITGQFEQAPRPVTRETSMPTPSAPPQPIGRTEAPVNPQAIADAVADVFDATQDLLMDGSVQPKDIAERLLDIALQHVPAESGSFYLADVNGHELNFAAVRGPKASEIQKKKLSVKIGQGIVGFCALEGVCLSVSDIQKDPRYFSAISDAVGYSPKDTLCASAEKDGRLFGALQLINSRGGFTPVHMEVMRYIGLTAASLLERHFDTQ